MVFCSRSTDFEVYAPRERPVCVGGSQEYRCTGIGSPSLIIYQSSNGITMSVSSVIILHHPSIDWLFPTDDFAMEWTTISLHPYTQKAIVWRYSQHSIIRPSSPTSLTFSLFPLISSRKSMLASYSDCRLSLSKPGISRAICGLRFCSPKLCCSQASFGEWPCWCL